jgi:tetratricopeptide (TPR) repeat protein
MRALAVIALLLLTIGAPLHAAPRWGAPTGRPPAQDGALSSDPGELAKQIRLARRQGDAERMLARLSDLPSRTLRDERVQGERLQALLDLHRFDEAVQLSQTRVSGEQGLVIPMAVALTRLSFRRGDIRGAEKNIALVRKTKPHQKDLAVLELRISIYNGDYKAANKAFGTLRDGVHTALAIELEVDLAVARAAELMGVSDMLEMALPLLKRAVDLAPERVDARGLYVRALSRWQRAEQAETVAREGLARAVGSARTELLYALGFLYLTIHREEEAVQLFEQALELAPEHGLARVGLARARMQVGDVDGARDLIARTLAGDARNLDALLLLSEIESDLGDWDSAAAALTTLLEVKPRHLKGLWLLSRVRARQRRPDEVQALLERYEERKQVLAARG